MTDPVLLLDVDAVLNAVPAGWSALPRHATASTNGQTYRLCWAPELLDRLRSWHLDGRVELRWEPRGVATRTNSSGCGARPH